MIYSNERKLCLSGWLKENSEKSYSKSLKPQKFLLLYEAKKDSVNETRAKKCGFIVETMIKK